MGCKVPLMKFLKQVTLEHPGDIWRSQRMPMKQTHLPSLNQHQSTSFAILVHIGIFGCRVRGYQRKLRTTTRTRPATGRRCTATCGHHRIRKTITFEPDAAWEVREYDGGTCWEVQFSKPVFWIPETRASGKCDRIISL